MKRTTRTSQAGFSLVELMVVVAIIGVLAAIAVPAVNKYIAKARQTEAKTNLASLYTSEKAFYAEYTSYDPRFGAIGYSPEGQLRYNVGFESNVAVATAANGFNTPAASIAAFSKTQTYCGANGAMTRGCTMLNGANGSAVTATLPSTSLTQTAFTAAALARIHSTATVDDTWTMDDSKRMVNTVNGIP
ncbi:pilus assembly protein PilA [Bdellovibrio sp. ZAP7]|uniref:type IV pilin protein n=1 Tax=Bdellovibrio sp. ZAP7 TaxID=2231053 RepID=UPI00115A8DA5|nr:prepilin-type N-terminal cleavage/methylation domain-containing protein [Bdellovibrio sp. ZAP7]QDK46183.1 pilus assembly protein PilA [Bdellovibrio sp. ZAP7]